MALVAGVEYTFIITATNAAGSQVIGTAKATPFTRPGVPGVGTVTLTDKTAVITLVQAAANGSQITQYNYSTTGTAGPWMIATGTNTVSVTLPAPGTYTITLQAQNSAGTGLPGTNTYGPVEILYRKDTIATVTGAFSITTDTTTNSNDLYVGLASNTSAGSIRKIITNGTNIGTASLVGTSSKDQQTFSLAINPGSKQIYQALNTNILMSPAPIQGRVGTTSVTCYTSVRTSGSNTDNIFGIAMNRDASYIYIVSNRNEITGTNFWGIQRASINGTSLTNDLYIPLSNGYGYIATDKEGTNDVVYVNDIGTNPPATASRNLGRMRKIVVSTPPIISDVTYITGTSSAIGMPIVVDSNHNIYYYYYSNTAAERKIYKITPTGERSEFTFRTQDTGFTNVSGMTIGNNGILYVVDNPNIIAIT